MNFSVFNCNFIFIVFLINHSLSTQQQANVQLNRQVLRSKSSDKGPKNRINIHLDLAQPWDLVQSQLSSTPYLLCQLRTSGIFNGHPRIALSPCSFSALVCLSATIKVMAETIASQRRFIKAINVNEPTKRHKYGVMTVEKLLRCPNHLIVDT